MEPGKLYDRERLLRQLGSAAGEPRTSQESHREAGQGKDTQESQKPAEAKQNPYLQAQIDQKKALEVYQTYQDNIKLCDGLKTKILKGIPQGVDIYTLLYWALQAVSKTTHDELFLSQAWTDIRLIHGRALGEPGPLKMEIETTRDRLERIKAAAERETEPGARARMKAAIKAHEKIMAYLEGRAG